MAKELPYFKFEPNQWENGNIQICTHEEKGVFIDLCSMYWSRLGDVSFKLAVQKLCGGNATALHSLCENKIIEVIDENIYINYLSEQLNDFEDTSKKNSKNAKEGWIKRRLSKDKSEHNATAKQPQSERNAIREEKIKENIIFSFNEFWELYPNKTGKQKSEQIFKKLKDSELQKIKDTLKSFINFKPFETYNHPNPTTYLNQKRWEDVIPQKETVQQTSQSVIDEARQDWLKKNGVTL
jgi:hypothetical protein